MKPAGFDYARCDTVDDALELLARHGEEARVIAGGQSLMAMLNMRLLRPSILVDISGLSDLSYVKEASGFIEIGAATTQAALEAWPQAAGAPSSRRCGDAAHRTFPDSRPRNHLRIALSCRSELGAAALSRDIGRRGPAAVAA